MILDLYRVNLSLRMLTFSFSYRKCVRHSYSLNHWSKRFMMFWEEGKVITVFLVLVHVSNKECPSPPASPQSAPKRATKRERESERERERKRRGMKQRERETRENPCFHHLASFLTTYFYENLYTSCINRSIIVCQDLYLETNFYLNLSW